MENTKAQNSAGLIALLQENKSASGDFAFLRLSLEKINERLNFIESRIAFSQPQTAPPNIEPNHPSRERFEIPEANSNERGGYETEKSCPYEPTGKLCDHCSMCSSLGF